LVSPRISISLHSQIHRLFYPKEDERRKNLLPKRCHYLFIFMFLSNSRYTSFYYNHLRSNYQSILEQQKQNERTKKKLKCSPLLVNPLKHTEREKNTLFWRIAGNFSVETEKLMKIRYKNDLQTSSIVYCTSFKLFSHWIKEKKKTWLRQTMQSERERKNRWQTCYFVSIFIVETQNFPK